MLGGEVCSFMSIFVTDFNLNQVNLPNYNFKNSLRKTNNEILVLENVRNGLEIHGTAVLDVLFVPAFFCEQRFLDKYSATIGYRFRSA